MRNSTIEMVRAIALLVLVLCLSYAAAVNAHEEVTGSRERRSNLYNLKKWQRCDPNYDRCKRPLRCMEAEDRNYYCSFHITLIHHDK
ncbi:hypothetical protein ACROYT_G027729 [Oculina patagonica]